MYTAQSLSLPDIDSAREWIGVEGLDYLGWWKRANNTNLRTHFPEDYLMAI
jgi:hypothetical protein